MYTFEITTKVHSARRVNGQIFKSVFPTTISVNVNVEGNVCKLGYGYKCTEHHRIEDASSTIPGEPYTIFNWLKPKEGDIWKYKDRTFTLGKVDGFLCYNAPLLENGERVATVVFEDYYKD